MSKNALQKGRSDLHNYLPEDLTILGLDCLDEPGFPPYAASSSRDVSLAFVRSIKKRGVKVPIRTAQLGDRVIVVDGRNRVRAARQANIALKAEAEAAGESFDPILVPSFPTRGSKDDLADTMAVTNTHRREIGHTEQALKVAYFMERRNGDRESVAEVLNISVSSVKAYEKLFACSDEVKAAVEAGTLPLTAAVALADKSELEQNRVLAELRNEAAAKTGGETSSASAVEVPQTATRVTVRAAQAKARGVALVKVPGRKKLLALRTGLAARGVAEVPWNELLAWLIDGKSEAWIDEAIATAKTSKKAEGDKSEKAEKQKRAEKPARGSGRTRKSA